MPFLLGPQYLLLSPGRVLGYAKSPSIVSNSFLDKATIMGKSGKAVISRPTDISVRAMSSVLIDAAR